MTQAVCRRPVIAKADFDTRAGHVEFMVDRVSMGHISPVIIIPPMFHIHP
jgi:3,4-dihydroxy-2-butanone 4-phosphate synthase